MSSIITIAPKSQKTLGDPLLFVFSIDGKVVSEPTSWEDLSVWLKANVKPWDTIQDAEIGPDGGLVVTTSYSGTRCLQNVSWTDVISEMLENYDLPPSVTFIRVSKFLSDRITMIRWYWNWMFNKFKS